MITCRIQKGIIIPLILIFSNLGLSSSEFCHFLQKDFYTYETIPPRRHQYQLRSGKSLIFSSCHTNKYPKKSCSKGNTVLVGDNGFCKTVSYLSKGRLYKWDRKRYPETIENFAPFEEPSILQEEIEDDPQNNKGLFEAPSMVFNSTILYSWKIDPILQPELISENIHQIRYAFVCPEVFKESKLEGETYFYRSQKSLTLVYTGVRACGFNFIEITIFIKRHKNFALGLGLVSLLILIYSRIFKRFTLWLIGLEVGVFICLIFMADFEEISHFEGSQLYSLYIVSILVGSMLGIFTAYSPESALYLQAVSAGLVSAFNFGLIYILVSGNGFSRTLFWMIFGILAVVIVMFKSSPKFPDNLAFVIFINYNQPLYFFMCLGLYIGFYPDILTINIAKEYGLDLKIDKINWLMVLGQTVVSLILIFQGLGYFNIGWIFKRQRGVERKNSEFKSIKEI